MKKLYILKINNSWDIFVRFVSTIEINKNTLIILSMCYIYLAKQLKHKIYIDIEVTSPLRILIVIQSSIKII